MINKSKLLLLPVIPLLLSGCLEHRYFITILPENHLKVHYELRGDRPDIEDGNELLPDSVAWGLVRTMEETEDQTTHIYTGEKVLNSPDDLTKALKWGEKAGDSIYVAPDVILHSKLYPLLRIWRFRADFPSRQFIELYGDMWEYVPEECRALEDEEAMQSLSTDESTILERKFGLGVIQWTRARYEKSFDDVWRAARARPNLLIDTTETSMAILRIAWVADIHAYLNGLDVGDPQTTKLNWWKDLRQMMLGRFVEITDVNRIDELGRIADSFENKYSISKDMEDDNFAFEINIPGRVVKTNGLKKDGKVIWELAGKEFQNEDQSLFATSFEIDWRQVAILLGLVGLSILVFSRKRGN